MPSGRQGMLSGRQGMCGNVHCGEAGNNPKSKKMQKYILPGFEPGTFCVAVLNHTTKPQSMFAGMCGNVHCAEAGNNLASLGVVRGSALFALEREPGRKVETPKAKKCKHISLRGKNPAPSAKQS